MTARKLLLAAVGILGAGIVAQVYAEKQYLFFMVGWLDTPMHFFSGIGAGFLTLWVMAVLGLLPLDLSTRTSWDGSFGPSSPWWRTLLMVLVGVAFIGMVWEMYEVFRISIADKLLPEGYIFDTVKDLVNDLLGASIAWGTFHRVQWGIWRKAEVTA